MVHSQMDQMDGASQAAPRMADGERKLWRLAKPKNCDPTEGSWVAASVALTGADASFVYQEP